MQQNQTVRGAIYGITAAAIWGGMYVVSDVVLPVIPPFTLLSLRLILGTLILAVLVKKAGYALPRGRNLLGLLAVGFLGFGISIGAQFIGTDESTAVNGSLVTSASPAFIVVFAAIILRESLNGMRIIAVVLATLGVLVIIDPTQADFSSATFRGDLFLAVAAVTWGLYSVLVRVVSKNNPTLVVTLLAFVGGMFLTLPASLLELPARPVGEITVPVTIGVLYLGVISTAVAMWLWNRAFALVDASLASLFFFAQPLVGALLAVIFLNQPMTPARWIGGALIIAGVLLAFYKPKRTAPSP